VPGGHTRAITTQREASRLLNTLEESCEEKAQRDKVIEYYVSSVRSASSRSNECTGPTHSEVLGKLKEPELLNTLEGESLQGVH